MRVRSLALHNVRRYAQLDIEFPPGVVLIAGPNGSGKTTVLEAIYLALTGSSFRPGSSGHALIRHGCDAGRIQCSLVGDERTLDIEVQLQPTGRIKRTLNGTSISARQPGGLNTAVTVFTPDDLELAKGPAEIRRSYLDNLAGFLVPRIAAVQADYDRVVRHRNALLKGDGDAHSESVFDEQLAVFGAEVTRARLGMISKLNPLIADAYRRISGAEMPAHLEYRSDWIPADATELEDLRVGIAAAIAAKRSQERSRKITLVGPHRDDVLGWIGTTSVRYEASQGEQRSVALALRLAGHHFLAQQMGGEPILLLDDVFSELDLDRSRRLLAELASPQTMVTRAGNPQVEVPYDGRVNVSEGKLTWE